MRKLLFNLIFLPIFPAFGAPEKYILKPQGIFYPARYKESIEEIADANNDRSFKRAVGAAVMSGECSNSGVGSKWLLQVQDLKRKTKVEATIRFTNEPAAESCMTGEWRRIIIEEKTTQDEKFFPLSGPLAYILDSDSLSRRSKVPSSTGRY